MRFVAVAQALLALLLLSPTTHAQHATSGSVPRDSQAVAVLQTSLSAMGGTVPSDAVATGVVVTVAGSETETGTIRVATRQLDQSREDIRTPTRIRSVIFSKGLASRGLDSTMESLSLQLAASSQSPLFPSVLIVGALSDPDVAIQYVALEETDSAKVHHVRFWNSFASNPDLQTLAELTVRDLWVDTVSGVPVKLAFDHRDGGEAAPRIPVAVFYGDYKSTGGLLIPFAISRWFNGTPWQTITIQQVSLNVGLTDSDFLGQ